MSVLGQDRGSDAGGYPQVAVGVAFGVVVAVLVEYRQAHHAPADPQRHLAGDLGDPACGVAGERAGGVEPEVHGTPGLGAGGGRCNGVGRCHAGSRVRVVMPCSRVRVTVAATSNLASAP